MTGICVGSLDARGRLYRHQSVSIGFFRPSNALLVQNDNNCNYDKTFFRFVLVFVVSFITCVQKGLGFVRFFSKGFVFVESVWMSWHSYYIGGFTFYIEFFAFFTDALNFFSCVVNRCIVFIGWFSHFLGDGVNLSVFICFTFICSISNRGFFTFFRGQVIFPYSGWSYGFTRFFASFIVFSVLVFVFWALLVRIDFYRSFVHITLKPILVTNSNVVHINQTGKIYALYGK